MGKKLDLRAKTSFDNEMKAEEFYRTAKRKLLRAFEWYDTAKIPASTFTLTDQNGNEILREMHENDILRIDIPGPCTKQGSGYDWVRVERIVDEKTITGEYCAITLRPTSNPKHHGEEEVAHFFKNTATSTLLVKRQNADVIAQYYGRNEIVNTNATKLTDKIRNLVVGVAAKLGMSFSQWKSLIEGIVDIKKGEKL
jgi:hypothetical protein